MYLKSFGTVSAQKGRERTALLAEYIATWGTLTIYDILGSQSKAMSLAQWQENLAAHAAKVGPRLRQDGFDVDAGLAHLQQGMSGLHAWIQGLPDKLTHQEMLSHLEPDWAMVERTLGASEAARWNATLKAYDGLFAFPRPLDVHRLSEADRPGFSSLP